MRMFVHLGAFVKDKKHLTYKDNADHEKRTGKITVKGTFKGQFANRPPGFIQRSGWGVET